MSVYCIVQIFWSLFVSQCIFLAIFNDKPLSFDSKVFLSHHLCAFTVCIAISVYSIGNLTHNDIFCDGGLYLEDPRGRSLSLCVIGLLIWDFSCMLVCKKLQSTVMLFHHVVMLLGVLVTLRPLAQRHVILLAGVTELSSVPLQFVEILHPKFSVLHTFASRNYWMRLCGQASTALFAMTFLLVRLAFVCPIVIWQIIPEVFSELHLHSAANTLFWYLLFLLCLLISMTALQLMLADLIFLKILKSLISNSFIKPFVRK